MAPRQQWPKVARGSAGGRSPDKYAEVRGIRRHRLELPDDSSMMDSSWLKASVGRLGADNT